MKYLELTFRVEPDGEMYAGYCEELEVASCGDSIEEATEMVKEACTVYLDGLQRWGRLDEVLASKGLRFKRTSEPKRAQKVSVPLALGDFVSRARIGVNISA